VDKRIRETSEQWDDVPAKVVGRRHAAAGGWSNADVLQQRVNQSSAGRARWPKGVYRFTTFEEADAWWIQNTTYPKM
jgi:hypothetical protein